MNQHSRRRPELVTTRNHLEHLARLRDHRQQKELLRSSDRRRNYERGQLGGMLLVGGAWLASMGLSSRGIVGLAQITGGAILFLSSFVMRASFWHETRVSKKEDHGN